MSRDRSPYLFSVKNFFTSLISIHYSGASLCRMMLMTSTLMEMHTQRSFPRYLQEMCTFQQVLPQRFLFWTSPSLKDFKDLLKMETGSRVSLARVALDKFQSTKSTI